MVLLYIGKPICLNVLIDVDHQISCAVQCSIIVMDLTVISSLVEGIMAKGPVCRPILFATVAFWHSSYQCHGEYMVENLYILSGEILSKIFVHVKSYKYEVCLLDVNNNLANFKLQ